VAIRAAVENVARNAVAVEIGLGSAADVPGTFDVVVANIVAPVLVAIAPALRARLAPGGALVLAGVTREGEAETVAVFRAAGLTTAERDQRDDWVCLLLR
ncbi:MAG: 50S ribosomal protein L11 methyltransferase, partial [Candidatus Limnocylindria bacterium]